MSITRPFSSLSAAVAAAALFTPAAQADLLVEFTTAEGYTSGSIGGQEVDDSTSSNVAWSSGSGAPQYAVDTTNDWVQFSNSVGTFSGVSTGNFDSALLGFDPANPGAGFTVSIDVDWIQNTGQDNGGVSDTQQIRFEIRDPGGNPYAGINVNGDGTLKSRSGGDSNSTTIADISGVTGFSTVDMAVDLVNSNVSYSLDGNPVTGLQDVAFLDSSANGDIGRFDFRQNFGNAGEGFVVRFDNLAVVPEPGSLGLSAIGGLLLMARRRRK